MERIVQRRTNQIVHGGVLDDVVLAARLLIVQDAADQQAGVADDEAARLQHQPALRLLHDRHDHLGEGGGRLRLLFAVVDAEAAAHVQHADRMALRPQLFDQRQPLGGAFAVRLSAEDRRTEVHVQADDAHVRIADHAASHVEDGFDVEAELDALDAGIGLDVRFGRQVRIDAQGDRGRFAERLGRGRRGRAIRLRFRR